MWRRKLFIFVFIAVLVPCFVYAQPSNEALSLQGSFVKVSKDVGPSVVSISTEHVERYRALYYPLSPFEDEFFKDFFIAGPEKEFKSVGLGSGVIIDKEGFILTNEHVVHGADRIKVTLPDGRDYEGRLTGSDVYSDLAVIKIEPKGKELPFAKLGDSDKVQIGEWAIAIGNPFAFAVRNPEPTVTVGVISALNRSLPQTNKRNREYSGLIQTDAAINPGNSGGPLVNIYGEVIGINVAIFTLSGGSEGIGFAVPINTAKRIMDDLMQGRKVLYGWIGVIIQDINSELADYFDIKDEKGVLISNVLDESPAEKSGLKPGDMVVSFDNEKVRNTQDLIRMVMKKDIGDKALLGIIRDKKFRTIDVEIAQRPGEGERKVEIPRHKREVVSEGEVALKSWRGIQVSEITPQILARFNLHIATGVIVISVEPESPAERAGIRVGDVIYELNRKSVRNIADYRNAVKRTSGDVLVGTDRGYVVVREK